MKRASLAALGALLVAFHPAAGAQTTLEQRITGDDPSLGFSWLRTAPGEPFLVRGEIAAAQDGRERRRVSLAYFGQISDLQLADEESPARVEFLDPEPSGLAAAAWRPQEALVPHVTDWTVRQLNGFAISPVRQGSGARARLLNAVMTGDLSDNMQRNETEWVLRVLEGGTLDPNSGTAELAGTTCPPGTPLDDPRNYTGVQDYSDAGTNPAFYDPNQPEGRYAGWPLWEGLMDRAQRPFQAQGLNVPFYVVFGNHDGLVQGNEDATRAIEDIATGCVKAVGQGQAAVLVPPDARRQFVDKKQFKGIFAAGGQADDHGFAFIDPAELRASSGAASYYAWSPAPGIRFIVLDTLAEGGVVSDSAEGNIDDPQFRWLERELEAASARDELIVPFSHHAKGNLVARTADEAAPACTTSDAHGHDVNPGCDRDPRSSQPLHDGDDVEALFHRFPHVTVFVAGHSHQNRIGAFPGEGGGGYWEIRSASVADWPPQHRVIELMDNCDGTLSVFGTLLDAAAAVRAPDAGPAAGFSDEQLASIGRTLTWNDPQQLRFQAEGAPADRNVELLVRDPRRRPPSLAGLTLSVSPKLAAAGRTTRFRFTVTGMTAGSRRGIAGANVQFAGRRATTNAHGVAVLRVRLRGERRLGRVSARVGCTADRAAAAVRVVRASARRRPAVTG